MGPKPPTLSWFYAPRAPNFDCSPEGTLALGTVITDPFAPDRPLVSGRPSPLPGDIDVEERRFEAWEQTNEQRQDGKLGLWARFLTLVEAENIGINLERAHSNTYRFEALEVRKFDPPAAFIKERMGHPEVAEYALRGSFRPPVYMVTSVMIARNPAVSKSNDGSWGVNFKVGTDLTFAGLPDVSIGADNAFSRSRHEHTSFTGSSDFIFAYRLSQITYKRKALLSGEKSLVERPYHTGAMFADEGPTQDDTVVFELDVSESKLQDVTSETLGCDSETAFDDFDETRLCERVVELTSMW
jgi:hypothetical protein